MVTGKAEGGATSDPVAAHERSTTTTASPTSSLIPFVVTDAAGKPIGADPR